MNEDDYCDICGSPLEWEQCGGCGGEGYIEVYDADPMWYSPGETEICMECQGEGGWRQCANLPHEAALAQEHSMGKQDEARPLLWDDRRIEDYANQRFDVDAYFEVVQAMTRLRDEYEARIAELTESIRVILSDSGSPADKYYRGFNAGYDVAQAHAVEQPPALVVPVEVLNTIKWMSYQLAKSMIEMSDKFPEDDVRQSVAKLDDVLAWTAAQEVWLDSQPSKDARDVEL
jgi:hypothetical protein